MATPGIRWLAALLVAAHGLVYLNASRGVLPVFDGWRGRSWLLGPAVTETALKHVCVALWAVAGVAILATGVAIGLAPETPAVWRTLAVAGSAVGVASFLLFWDGQVERLFAQGVVGMAISLAMLAIALGWDAHGIPAALVP